MLKNTSSAYGLVAKVFHWLSALVIFSLFALGFWMVDLSYDNSWYQTAPHWHESVGILLALATFFRMFWRTISIRPIGDSDQSSTEAVLALFIQYLFYLLLLTIMFSGYFIVTADGRAIDVFTWFALPSLGELFAHQEDISGAIHQYGAYFLMVLALLHIVAALKHHFVDKDDTLTRMC